MNKYKELQNELYDALAINNTYYCRKAKRKRKDKKLANRSARRRLRLIDDSDVNDILLEEEIEGRKRRCCIKMTT